MSSKIRVRPAGPKDIPALDSMLFRAFDTLLRPDYPAEVLERAVPMMGRARVDLVVSGTYFVATDDKGRIVGAGGGPAAPPHGGEQQAHVGNVRHFGVDPDAARRGVASAVMERVIRDAAAHGVTQLDCLSTRSAVAFYKSMGFDVIGQAEVALARDVAFPVVRVRRRVP
jgi:N-acetylglutamate synthase-like GNAT family acetyltransferase